MQRQRILVRIQKAGYSEARVAPYAEAVQSARRRSRPLRGKKQFPDYRRKAYDLGPDQKQADFEW